MHRVINNMKIVRLFSFIILMGACLSADSNSGNLPAPIPIDFGVNYGVRSDSTICESCNKIYNAEEMREFLTMKNELDGPIFKIENDPRITKIGKILRKFSIDEMLQLINVLKGDMNLVGPRPYPIEEVQNFNDKSFYRRHSMKPGITGLWQIKGRSDLINFNECIKLDLDYIDHWSFRQDLYIAIMTIPAIIKGTGK